MLDRALASRQAMFGEEHLDVAVSLVNLAVLDGSQGRYTDAEALLRRGLKIREQVLGADHPLIGHVCLALATVLEKTGRKEEASELRRRAKPGSESVVPLGTF